MAIWVLLHHHFLNGMDVVSVPDRTKEHSFNVISDLGFLLLPLAWLVTIFWYKTCHTLFNMGLFFQTSTFFSEMNKVNRLSHSVQSFQHFTYCCWHWMLKSDTSLSTSKEKQIDVFDRIGNLYFKNSSITCLLLFR